MDEDKIGCMACEQAFDSRDDDLVVTICDHVFHRACLEGWCSCAPICPTCNYPLKYCMLTPVRFTDIYAGCKVQKKGGGGGGGPPVDKDKKIRYLERRINTLQQDNEDQGESIHEYETEIFKFQRDCINKTMSQVTKINGDIKQKDKDIASLKAQLMGLKNNAKPKDSLALIAEEMQLLNAQLLSLA